MNKSELPKSVQNIEQNWRSPMTIMRFVALVWILLLSSSFFMWVVIRPPEDFGYMITLIGGFGGVVATIVAAVWGIKKP